MGPAERVQAVNIARQYYLEGMSKIEIGACHGLSRFKIARILENCLSEGIVKIEITSGTSVETALSEQLQHHYGLKHALVISGTFPEVSGLRESLGQVAAELLEEIVTEDDVLGLAWGRTLDATARKIHHLPPCRIVQMTGIAGSIGMSNLDLMRDFASASQGETDPIYAPLIVSDHETLLCLQKEPGIKAALSRWPDITIAVIAIGNCSAEGSQIYAMLTQSDRNELNSLDMACEFCAIPLDRNGTPLQTSLRNRTLGIDYETLQNIPEVIAIAGGLSKYDAIHAALKSGVITSLVTDESVARALMAQD